MRALGEICRGASGPLTPAETKASTAGRLVAAGQGERELMPQV